MESWKSVVGFEGIYSVSDHGGVRRDCSGGNSRPGRIVSGVAAHNGYLRISLCYRNKKTNAAVHRLVTAAFIGPCPIGMQVNHKNGVKSDNRLTNLEYVTPTENIRHATYVIKTIRPGEDYGNAKLTNAQVESVRGLSARGWTNTRLAKRFAVSGSAIGRIVNGQTWKFTSRTAAG